MKSTTLLLNRFIYLLCRSVFKSKAKNIIDHVYLLLFYLSNYHLLVKIVRIKLVIYLINKFNIRSILYWYNNTKYLLSISAMSLPETNVWLSLIPSKHKRRQYSFSLHRCFNWTCKSSKLWGTNNTRFYSNHPLTISVTVRFEFGEVTSLESWFNCNRLLRISLRTESDESCSKVSSSSWNSIIINHKTLYDTCIYFY